MTSPLVVIVGRRAGDARGVRGEPYALGRRYCDAVVRAGGTPLMVPPNTALIDSLPGLVGRIDGLVMHGGGDIDPALYGETPAPGLYDIVAEHDAVELAIVRAAVAADLPVLAICRGMQMLNIALGGSLVQDIGTDTHWHRFNPAELEGGSLVAKAMGADHPAACHCVHHQILDRLGDGLRVTGTMDAMVHAVELSGNRWTVGVQWHPEDSAVDDPEQQGLFDELVRQA
jgi:putative glutamine amidotransferase